MKTKPTRQSPRLSLRPSRPGPPLETPHFDYPEIVTGHFHEKAGYAARREHGTDDWLLIYTAAGEGGSDTAPASLLLIRATWCCCAPALFTITALSQRCNAGNCSGLTF